MWVLSKAGVKREVIDTQNQETSILWSHHGETRKLPGERDNARNNSRCTQARKTTHGLDGQHQDVDRTSSGRINQNDSTDKWRKYVHGSKTTKEQNKTVCRGQMQFETA